MEMIRQGRLFYGDEDVRTRWMVQVIREAASMEPEDFTGRGLQAFDKAVKDFSRLKRSSWMHAAPYLSGR